MGLGRLVSLSGRGLRLCGSAGVVAFDYAGEALVVALEQLQDSEGLEIAGAFGGFGKLASGLLVLIAGLRRICLPVLGRSVARVGVRLAGGSASRRRSYNESSKTYKGQGRRLHVGCAWTRRVVEDEARAFVAEKRLGT